VKKSRFSGATYDSSNALLSRMAATAPAVARTIWEKYGWFVQSRGCDPLPFHVFVGPLIVHSLPIS
jgi:hypothetical protein